MTINPHDDYEALAKLLYPSIEASGNVYYGQTRKLAIDELFDKNNNGFESYFCSCRKEDDSSQYEQHFHWKLGPFSDTVKIVDDNNEYKKYPVAWLKYSLPKKETEHKHVINSGKYSTYEVEYTLGQPSLYCSLDGLLPNGDTYDNRSFFLDCDGDNKVLYILLYKAPVYEDMDKPLYIEALTDHVTISLQTLSTGEEQWTDELKAQCKYKYGYDDHNQPYTLALDTLVLVPKGIRAYIRCEDRPEFSDGKYLQLKIKSLNEDAEDAEVAVGGNIESMAKFDENGDMLNYAYYCLFRANSLITDASRLYIGKLSNYHSCSYLFSECFRLKTAPSILPCLQLESFCYHNMFCWCSDLEKAPILPARNGASACYMLMFQGLQINNINSDKLHNIICLLKLYSDNYASGLLYNRTDVESITVLQNSGWESATSDTIPNDCRIEELESTIYTSSTDISVSNMPTEKYLVTHGTNNESNGRGYITDPSTLANMEKSFDENNNHPMNTYNSDGSFNQEIWGYKSFCSPVQFRNGIYGEDWSIYTYGYGNNSTSVVISRDESQSASIEIMKQPLADAIILSSVKPDVTADAAKIAIISEKRDNSSTSSILFTADIIELLGPTHTNNLFVRSDISASNIYVTQLTVNESTTFEGTTNISGPLNISNDTTISSELYSRGILPTDSDTYNIGSSNKRYSHVYTANLDVDKIYTSEILASSSSLEGIQIKSAAVFEKAMFANDIFLYGEMVAADNNTSIGTAIYPINKINAISASFSDMPMSVRYVQNTKYPPLIYGGQDVKDAELTPIMHGEIGGFTTYNEAANEYVTEAGTIVYGWVVYDKNSQPLVTTRKHPGDIIVSAESSRFTIYEASISEVAVNLNGRKFYGWFRLLSLVTLEEDNDYKAKALLIQVAQESPTYSTT